MFRQKTFTPVDGLFDQGYKHSYFCEDLSKYEENHLKSVETNIRVLKSLNTWYKKNIFHIEMMIPFCPECFSKYAIKNGFKERTFIFIIKELLTLKFKCINVKNTVKSLKPIYQTL